MNDKEEVVIGYLDPIERVQDLEDEFPSYFNGLPVPLSLLNIDFHAR